MKIRAFREECPFFIFENRIKCFTQNEDYVLEWSGKHDIKSKLMGIKR